MTQARDPFDGLPGRFDYVREVVLKYGRRGRSHDEDEWRRSLRNLSALQLREITDAYERLTAPEERAALLAHVHAIGPAIRRAWKEWQRRRDEAEDQGLPWPPEPPQESGAERLFDLFDELAELRKKPFTSRRVEYEPPPPDWSRLPERLRYLIEPATKWGHIQFYEEIDKLKRKGSAKDKAELRALAQRLRDSGDWAAAFEWNANFDMTEHSEAALLYWLLNLLREVAPDLCPT